MSDRKTWLKELRMAERGPRVLTEESNPPKLQVDREQCVICGRRTITWLMPENAPLCSDDCLTFYLEDPSVYDPRELHSRPSPRLATVDGTPVKPYYRPQPKRRRRNKGRWEPSDEEIAEMQKKIAAKFGLPVPKARK